MSLSEVITTSISEFTGNHRNAANRCKKVIHLECAFEIVKKLI